MEECLVCFLLPMLCTVESFQSVAGRELSALYLKSPAFGDQMQAQQLKNSLKNGSLLYEHFFSLLVWIFCISFVL